MRHEEQDEDDCDRVRIHEQQEVHEDRGQEDQGNREVVAVMAAG